MTLLDFPLESRFRAIEDRLTAIERDLAVLTTLLTEMDKRIPSVWLLVGLILPIYGLMIFGFAGLFYFLLNYSVR